MPTARQALLALLCARPGQDVSGQALADELGVSRAAVHKAAAALQKQGYAVRAVSGRGYRLEAESDLLTQSELEALWPRPCRALAQVDSTNREARRMALDGAPHGALVVAGAQAEGRGRAGRTFLSPEGGVYLSLLLRPGPDWPGDVTAVTAAAGVAAARAVERLCGRSLRIKWVNDLYWQGRKVGGILTEGLLDMESGRPAQVVVGIGINLRTPASLLAGAPEAGSLYPDGAAPCGRARLAAAIAGELLAWDGSAAWWEEYRARSLVLGHWLTVTEPGGSRYTALARAIDDEGRLVVQLPGGGVRALRSGEVRTRPAPRPGETTTNHETKEN